MKRLVFVLALTPILLVSACERPADPPPVEDVGVLPPEMQEEVRQLRVEVNTAIAEADMALESFQVQAGAAEENLRADLEEAVTRLREQRETLREDFQEFETATAEEFSERRAEVRRKLEDLESNLADARERFRAESEERTS